MSNLKTIKCKLGDVADFISGFAFKSDDFSNEGIPLVKITNIGDYYNSREFISKNTKIDSKFIVNYGDILIAMSGSIGKIGRYPLHNKSYLNQRVGKIFPNNKNLIQYDFLYHLICSDQILKQLSLTSAGGTLSNISQEQILDLEIEIPVDLKEQKRIAEILSNVDDNIRVVEEEITNHQSTKRTLMNEILSKILGEEKSIEDSNIKVIEGDRGSNYPSEGDYSPTGYCLFLNAKNVTSNGFEFSKVSFISKEKDEILRRGKLKENDIVLTTRGTVGNMAFYNLSHRDRFKNVRINSGMVIIRNEEQELLTDFLFNYLKEYVLPQKNDVSSGSVIKQLPSGEINKFMILIPSQEDQIKANSIIFSMNSVINVLEEKLSKLKQIKKGILNNIL